MSGMSSFKNIPIETGTKYRTPEGVVAVRNGIKRGNAAVDTSQPREARSSGVTCRRSAGRS